jgi:hypothetical protein
MFSYHLLTIIIIIISENHSSLQLKYIIIPKIKAICNVNVQQCKWSQTRNSGLFKLYYYFCFENGLLLKLTKKAPKSLLSKQNQSLTLMSNSR